MEISPFLKRVVNLTRSKRFPDVRFISRFAHDREYNFRFNRSIIIVSPCVVIDLLLRCSSFRFRNEKQVYGFTGREEREDFETVENRCAI